LWWLVMIGIGISPVFIAPRLTAGSSLPFDPRLFTVILRNLEAT